MDFRRRVEKQLGFGDAPANMANWNMRIRQRSAVDERSLAASPVVSRLSKMMW